MDGCNQPGQTGVRHESNADAPVSTSSDSQKKLDTEIKFMCRLTKQVKFALGIAGAFLVGNTANAQEYFDYVDAAPYTFQDVGVAQPAAAAAG